MLEKKFKSKLINIDSIDASCAEASQARHATVSDTRDLQRSIANIGLQVPIDVEIINWDAENEDNSDYRLRDGNHRLKAMEALRAAHPNEEKYNHILCTVYEKNTDPQAEMEWLAHQFNANTHEDKVHKKASNADAVVTISQLLTNGYGLFKDVSKHIDADNWDHPSIANSIKKWLAENFSYSSHGDRDNIVASVYASQGKKYNASIKRYPSAEWKEWAREELGIPNSGKVNDSGNQRTWIASGDDWWTKVLAPIANLCTMGKKDVQNVIIFHSKRTNSDDILKERAKVKATVADINRYFSANVKGFKHVKLIDDVKALGQIKPQGEKPFQLYNL